MSTAGSRRVTRLGRARRRDRRIMVAASAVAVLALGAGAVHGATASPPPPNVQTHALTAGDTVTLGFAGDTMLDDRIAGVIAEHGIAEVLAGVTPFLQESDFALINAEAPITDRPAYSGKRFEYSVPPSTLPGLVDAGVDALGLANNHTMDAGPEGLEDTIAHAADAGLITAGAGATEVEAERPLVLTAEARTVGIVLLSEYYGRSSRATEDHPGVISFTEERIQRGHDLARAAGADDVIAYVHWGDNYGPVSDQQRFWAEKLAAAGYDLVIGSGSHSAQPVAHVDGVPIVWGLGNFVFGSRGRYEEFDALPYGLFAQVTWHPDGSRHLDITCLVTDNVIVDYRTRACDDAERADLLTHLGGGLTPTERGGRLIF
ncbi:MAG: CapA family protein [Mobilicoccus sp.]|nr:CapA family protein [Mobilicoccus sp.]